MWTLNAPGISSKENNFNGELKENEWTNPLAVLSVVDILWLDLICATEICTTTFAVYWIMNGPAHLLWLSGFCGFLCWLDDFKRHFKKIWKLLWNCWEFYTQNNCRCSCLRDVIWLTFFMQIKIPIKSTSPDVIRSLQTYTHKLSRDAGLSNAAPFSPRQGSRYVTKLQKMIHKSGHFLLGKRAAAVCTLLLSRSISGQAAGRLGRAFPLDLWPVGSSAGVTISFCLVSLDVTLWGISTMKVNTVPAKFNYIYLMLVENC